jgi:hypothetical protein
VARDLTYSGWRAFWHRLTVILDRGLITAMAIVSAAIASADSPTDGGIYATAVQYLRTHAVYILPIGVCLDVLLRLARKILQPSGLVQALLDGLAATVYGDRQGKRHHHRATLFQHGWCLRRRWPWTGWLKIKARSGHTTQGSRTSFRANQRDPDNVEGVAGETWTRSEIYMVDGLPDLNGIRNRVDREPIVAQYAKATSAPVEWVWQRIESGQHVGRSFCGLPVMSGGSMWGVIVLDSVDPTGLEQDRVLAVYHPISQMLDQLIARGLV